MTFHVKARLVILPGLAIIGGLFLAQAQEGQFGTPKAIEGTRIFKPAAHPFYSGAFRITGQRATLVGSMRDASPWDHL